MPWSGPLARVVAALVGALLLALPVVEGARLASSSDPVRVSWSDGPGYSCRGDACATTTSVAWLASLALLASGAALALAGAFLDRAVLLRWAAAPTLVAWAPFGLGEWIVLSRHYGWSDLVAGYHPMAGTLPLVVAFFGLLAALLFVASLARSRAQTREPVVG